jgi:hypothetical protein
VGDLFRQPHVRHDREAEAHEVGRVVCEGAERREAAADGARGKLGDERGADLPAAGSLVHDERAHLGDRRAQRRELGAGNYPSAGLGDEKARGVRLDVRERTGQQVARLEVLDDQVVNRRGVVGRALAERGFVHRRHPRAPVRTP